MVFCVKKSFYARQEKNLDRGKPENVCTDPRATGSVNDIYYHRHKGRGQDQDTDDFIRIYLLKLPMGKKRSRMATAGSLPPPDAAKGSTDDNEADAASGTVSAAAPVTSSKAAKITGKEAVAGLAAAQVAVSGASRKAAKGSTDHPVPVAAFISSGKALNGAKDPARNSRASAARATAASASAAAPEDADDRGATYPSWITECSLCSADIESAQFHCNYCGRLFCLDCAAFVSPSAKERVSKSSIICGNCYHNVAEEGLPEGYVSGPYMEAQRAAASAKGRAASPSRSSPSRSYKLAPVTLTPPRGKVSI